MIELQWFHLDFRFEAFAGLVGALGCAFVLFRAIQRGARQMRSGHHMLWLGMRVSLISLNATDVWSWPLWVEGESPG